MTHLKMPSCPWTPSPGAQTAASAMLLSQPRCFHSTAPSPPLHTQLLAHACVGNKRACARSCHCVHRSMRVLRCAHMLASTVDHNKIPLAHLRPSLSHSQESLKKRTPPIVMALTHPLPLTSTVPPFKASPKVRSTSSSLRQRFQQQRKEQAHRHEIGFAEGCNSKGLMQAVH